MAAVMKLIGLRNDTDILRLQMGTGIFENRRFALFVAVAQILWGFPFRVAQFRGFSVCVVVIENVSAGDGCELHVVPGQGRSLGMEEQRFLRCGVTFSCKDFFGDRIGCLGLMRIYGTRQHTGSKLTPLSDDTAYGVRKLRVLDTVHYDGPNREESVFAFSSGLKVHGADQTVSVVLRPLTCGMGGVGSRCGRLQ